MGKALLWLLAALLGVSLCCILLLGTAALLVDTNREYPTDKPLLPDAASAVPLYAHQRRGDGGRRDAHLSPCVACPHHGDVRQGQAENPDSVSLHFQRSAYPPQRDGGSADRSSAWNLTAPLPSRLTARPPPTSPPMRSLAMAAALPDNDYRSMLNFSIAKGSGSPPDPHIDYRSNFYEL